MTGWIAFGVFVIAICMLMVVLSRRAARRRTARAAYAHSEPGGPHVQHHDGASGLASAKLAESVRDWGGY